MHRLINWLISVALILVLAILLWAVVKGMSSQDGVSDNVVIALIGAITAAITIVGSVFIAQLTASNEGRKQRQTEARNLKREFYNRFLEQFSRKMAAINSPAGDDFEENQRFCIEVNRLPLYASQAVVAVNAVPCTCKMFIFKQLRLIDMTGTVLEEQNGQIKSI